MATSNNNSETVLIRDQLLAFRILFYNTIMGEPLLLPFKAVDELVIEENLMNWWTKGYITINNSFENIERGRKKPVDDKSLEWKNLKARDALFAIRQDGRNRINIKIETAPRGNNFITPENWCMNYDFVIYDIEDIETNSSIKKIKKFYFIDERYQIMAERNIPWSTSTHNEAAKSGLSPSTLTDIERKMLPNDAIKSILKTAACNDFTLGGLQTSEIKVGFGDISGSINNPDIPFDNIDEDNWASTDQNPNNLVFYTSPANSNVRKDIQTMLSMAKGPENDPVFLRFGRYDKKWSLVSLTDIFSKAKQVERMFLQDGLEPKTLTYKPRAQLIADNNNILNYHSGRASTIRNYKFSSMAPIDDMRLKNRPIHKMDFATGVYSIYFEENKAEKIFENINNLGAKGLYTFGTGEGNQVWLNINKTKLDGLCLENSFISQGPDDMAMVQMLKDSVFLNQALYFQTEGMTLRQPGTFIFMDRTDSSDVNLFDDKFLGQWLVNKVVHYFTNSKYITDVYANKIDGLHKHWDVLDKKFW